MIGYRSNPNDVHYDTIVFVLRDIIHAINLPFIKRVNPYAFSYCKNLTLIEFSENSELETIDDFAFTETSITKMKIPKSVKIIGNNAYYNYRILYFKYLKFKKIQN